MKNTYSIPINLKITLLCLLLVAMGCCVAYCQPRDTMRGIGEILIDYDEGQIDFAPCRVITWIEYKGRCPVVCRFFECKVPTGNYTETGPERSDYIVIEDDIMLRFTPLPEEVDRLIRSRENTVSR